MGISRVIFKFENPLTSTDSVAVTSGAGTVTSSGIGADTREYVVNLTGVTNAQRVGVTLNTVRDTSGNVSSTVAGAVRVLLGDVNGDGAVSASDVGSTKSRSGQTVDGTNFRADVNVNGAISAADVGAVKAASGTSVAP